MYFIKTDDNDFYKTDQYVTSGDYHLWKIKTGVNISDMFHLFPAYSNINHLYKYHINIHESKKSDTYIRVVITNLHFTYINNLFGPNNLLGIDKMIVSEKYNIYDLKTISKFNLKVLNAKYISEFYKYNNNENCLKLCNIILDECNKSSNTSIRDEIVSSILECNSAYGYINILEHIKNTGISLQNCTDKVMLAASQCGHVDVLEWWKNSGLSLTYNNYAMHFASQFGHVNVLEWWKNSGLLLKYNDDAIDDASQFGYINVLEWWKNSGLELKYSANSLKKAIENDRVNVIDWWMRSKLPLKYNIDSYVSCPANLFELLYKYNKIID
uniref:Ankyrin repeat protein n=1 Tax=viral metagenome TaxID=1070528 RepID=A0A6C0E7D1_9ZZZZ